MVIITGGIDLSIGSLIALTGTVLPYLLTEKDWSVFAAVLATMLLSLFIGLCHGLLITKLRLQPFIVTLFGLLFYRGIARWLTNDQSVGYGGDYPHLTSWVTGRIALPGLSDPQEFHLPAVCLFMIVVTILAWFFLNQTIFGRYLFALGRNEEAARYSGIKTQRYVVLTYVICSGLAGLGGILFSLESGSVQPTGFGNFYELYAIAAAVLGGCSLRGGEGTILGVVIGAGILLLLRNTINLLGIPSSLEFAVVGGVILMGAIADELFLRLAVFARSRRRGVIEKDSRIAERTAQ